MKTLLIMTLVAMGALVSQAQAGHNCCCPSCGCSNVKKVCRFVQETKNVTTFCYDVECEDFCIPGPSPCCGTKCVPNDCPCTGCHKEHISGKPCSCTIRTRKVLVKIPVTKEIKVWTCKVERVCCGCGCAQLDARGTADAKAQEIMPASAEEPIVLDSRSGFLEGATLEATGSALDQDVKVSEGKVAEGKVEEDQGVQQTSATEEPAVASRPRTFLDRLLGK